MPLESLACTNCGSADVKEVKAETYFCNQCDSVFKYVVHGRVSATVGTSFCRCGNPVTAQCTVCRVSMLCAACDFSRVSAERAILTANSGFGYMMRFSTARAFLCPTASTVRCFISVS
jgi:hypothetical protein